MDRMRPHGFDVARDGPLRFDGDDARGSDAPDAQDARGGDDKPIRIFNIIEVSPQIVAYLQAGYNVISDFATKFVAQPVYDGTVLLAQRMGIKDIKRARGLAAATTFAVDTTIKSAGYVAPWLGSARGHRKQLNALARTLAPVLDELKGGHALVNLHAVGINDNEMIYAQRRRLAEEARMSNVSNVIDLIINAGPNVWFSAQQLHRMAYSNLSPRELALKEHADALKSEGNPRWEFRDAKETIVNTATAGIADYVKNLQTKALEKTRQHYSAMEMILALDEQLNKHPGATTIRAPGKDGDLFTLEKYVARIITQHQRDMADISPAHTEIRNALKEDLVVLVKPIAESIHKGKLSPLTLVRWVGEGKLVKDKGRALASLSEVQGLLGQQAAPHVPAITSQTQAINRLGGERAHLGTLHSVERALNT